MYPEYQARRVETVLPLRSRKRISLRWEPDDRVWSNDGHAMEILSVFLPYVQRGYFCAPCVVVGFGV